MSDFDVAVVGIPFDAGVSYRPGARFGPTAIRQGSRLLRAYHPDLDVYPFETQQVVDSGDLALNPFDIEEAVSAIEAAITAYTRSGVRVMALGGDHTIALPLLRSVHAMHGPIALVHFDAHLDTWDSYFGARYTHGTPFRRAFEEGLIDVDAAVHVGTRGPLYAADDLHEDAAMGFANISCKDVARTGLEHVVMGLRDRIGQRPVYVSVDIDVLDPAHAPGTGTPEAGGLSSRELLTLLDGFAGLHLVGADVVEVAPAYDHAEITAVAAAHVVYSLLALMSLHR